MTINVSSVKTGGRPAWEWSSTSGFASPDLIASLNSSKYPTNGGRKIEVELAALDAPHAEAEVLQPG
jgi:hypothetical protein